MKLKRFKVTDFRSVKDSGWIEVDDVAVLIGTNESGKTNLLLPLWKLNPAKSGEINTTADYLVLGMMSFLSCSLTAIRPGTTLLLH
jgi:recombinational DNA repair ATPase RecF